MIFCVKKYINKELVETTYFNNLQAAMSCANFYEDKDYICEIECYEYHKHISREFWRNAKVEIKN